MRFVNAGFGNMVSVDSIVAIFAPDSAPIKRNIANSKEKNMVYDATKGDPTRAVILTKEGYLILSPSLPETIAKRVSGKNVPDIEDS